MAIIDTWNDLETQGLLPLTEAEETLLHACRTGDTCKLGDATIPDVLTPDREVRAAVLRFFVLGGCEKAPVKGEGLRLYGAYVTGHLNLNFSQAHGATTLKRCRFDSQIYARQASFEMLDLSGSVFPGLGAQGAKVNGNVELRGCVSSSKVSFSGAQIGRQFSAIGAQLKSSQDFSLNLQGAHVQGPIFLHPTLAKSQANVETPFSSEGCVSFSRATIGALYAEHINLRATHYNDVLRAPNMTVKGDVRLANATVQGEVQLAGARIEGNLDCDKASFTNADGHSFNAQRARVEQAFIWKNVTHLAGKVSLNGAHVVELDDDPQAWPGKETLLLDGLTYNRIKGKVSTPPERRKWLEDGSYFDGEFRPQPYTQYAKFLRETGHDDQARKVMLEREDRIRRQERSEITGLWRYWRQFWDGLQKHVIGFGHQPFRSVIWLMLLIVATWIPATLAWEEGSMAPNSGPILVSESWQDSARSADTAGNPAAIWSQSVPGKDWESFNSFAYAMDVVIPIIDFGQTDAWSPSTERKWWGQQLWWWRWLMTLFGWIVTALGAAAITGIIRRD